MYKVQYYMKCLLVRYVFGHFQMSFEDLMKLWHMRFLPLPCGMVLQMAASCGLVAVLVLVMPNFLLGSTNSHYGFVVSSGEFHLLCVGVSCYSS